jgi:hypothetical protein
MSRTFWQERQDIKYKVEKSRVMEGIDKVSSERTCFC